MTLLFCSSCVASDHSISRAMSEVMRRKNNNEISQSLL